MDKASARNLIAVTDRRIITARTNALLGQGEIGRAIPVGQVRYVRAPGARDGSGRPVIDLITSEENIRWIFDSDVDDAQVAALAAVLAESMNIPDEERALLRQPRHTSLEAGTGDTSADSKSVEQPESESSARETR